MNGVMILLEIVLVLCYAYALSASSTSGSCSKAVALDIDGVLYRGGKVLSRTVEAMKLLESSKIPYVFVTNGGGITELEKSKELTKKIGVSVTPEQIIMSHTPFQSMAEEHKNQRVLVLGHERCLEVAKSYGFSKAVCVREIHEENPTMYPYRKPDNLPSSPHRDEPVEAVLVFHDCLDWGLEMQVVCDIILGRQQNDIQSPPSDSFRQRVPLYVSNADIVYSSDHPHPRFTQGAFVEAFKSLFGIYSGGQNLIIQTCGKPFKIQYDFARNLLAKEANLLGKTPITHYYGVGDNPKSDIRGANAAGDNWTSVLVRTGVFTGDINDDIDPADIVVGDVLDAVNFIISDTK